MNLSTLLPLLGKGAFALLFLIVGWLVATILAGLARTAATKLGADKAADKFTSDLGQSGRGFTLSNIIRTIVFWFVFLVVLAGVLTSLGLSGAAAPITSLLNGITGSIATPLAAIAYLLVGYILATLAKSALTTAFAKLNLEEKLQSHGLLQQDAVDRRPLGLIAGWGAYGLILFLFIGMAADTLHLTTISDSIGGITATIGGSLPNLLSAALVGLVAWFVAFFVKTFLGNLLPAIGADSLGAHIGLATDPGTSEGEGAKPALTVSSIAANAAYWTILIFAVPEVLNRLGNQTLAQPLRNAWNSIGAAVPNLLSAALIGFVAYVICRFVGPLVEKMLAGIGFDRILEVVGLTGLQKSVDGGRDDMKPSKIASVLVILFIAVLFAQQAFQQLGLTSFSTMLGSLVNFTPNIVIAVAIVGIGLYLGGLVSKLINESAGNADPDVRKTLGVVANVAVVTFTSAMALTQLNVAPALVQNAVLLLIAAVALALALAFGIGGKDTAARILEKHLAGK